MVKKSVSNAHFLVFLSRRSQNVENVHEAFINTKFLFKNELFFDHRVRNVPQVSSETLLPWLVQNKPSAPIRRVETRLNSSKDNIIAKSFRLPTKRRLSIPLNFLFPFVFHRRTFNLEMQDFSLENHHIMNARQPFC